MSVTESHLDNIPEALSHFIDEKTGSGKIRELIQGHGTWLWLREALSHAVSVIIASP